MNAHERRVEFRRTGILPTTKRPKKHARVPKEQWGHDHISTFAYVMSRFYNDGGVLVREHMRVGSHHPGLQHRGSTKDHPTQLRGGALLSKHDDYDCLDDIVAAGYIKYVGTGINPGKVFDPSPEAIAWQVRIAEAEAKHQKWSEVYP